MSKQTSPQLARDRRKAETRRHELVDLIARAIPQDGAIEPIKDLYLFRVSSPGEPIHSVYHPSWCVVAQGSKEFFLNDERYVYDPANYFSSQQNCLLLFKYSMHQMRNLISAYCLISTLPWSGRLLLK